MLPKNYSLRKILVVFSFFEIYCTRVGNSERFSQGKLWNFTANTNRRLELGTTFGVFFVSSKTFTALAYRQEEFS